MKFKDHEDCAERRTNEEGRRVCVVWRRNLREKRSSWFTSKEEVRQLKTNRGSNMNIHHSVICFFILSGNTGLITEGITIITGKEGGNIRHEWKYFFSGSWKAFYKEDDLLIETEKDKAQYGRYSIDYEPAAGLLSHSFLYVSITNLTKSDSGKYRCVLGKRLVGDSVKEFELRVEDAPTTLKPNWTPGPFPTSVPSTSTPTTTQSLISSSGSSTPSSVSPKTTQSQEQQTAAGRGTLLYVGLTLVIVIFILSAAVLIYCRKTASKPKGPPQETEYANVTKANPVYEDIREEDRQSRSPPVEISTDHAHAKYTKPNAAEGTDDYSFVTAASSQMNTKADSDKLTYSVVDFSNGAAASLNSAPRGDADNVIYSVPKVAETSDSRRV